MAAARKAADAPQRGHAIEPVPCARRTACPCKDTARYRRLKIGGATIESAVRFHPGTVDAIAVDGKVVP